MDVLDQRFAQEVGVAGVPQDHRDGGQAGHLGGTQTALPRDQFVPLAGLRTTMGCRIPTSRIEAASDAISSSSKWVRGCLGLGLTR